MWSQSHFRRMQRRRTIQNATSLPDALESLQMSEDTTHEEIVEAISSPPTQVTCGRCTPIFSKDSTLVEHESTCRSHQVSMVVVDRAVPFEMRMLALNDITIYRSGESNLVIDAIAESDDLFCYGTLVGSMDNTCEEESRTWVQLRGVLCRTNNRMVSKR